MNLLDVSELSKSYGTKKVLDRVSFTVAEGEKVGFIGRNGCGKTTLFRLAAGLDKPDGGTIASRRGITIGYLPQDPELDPGKTVAEEIETALGEIRRTLARYHAAGEAMKTASPAALAALLKEQESLGHWIEHHHGWDTDHRIDEVLSRLGIPDRGARVETLSGGLMKRVALGKLVLQSPDLLLLDEPTNHLDAATIEWLEAFLADYSGAVMLITHDRYFLDRLAQRIFELEGGTIYGYTGGYSDYLEGRATRLGLAEQSQDRLMNLLRRELAWMRRGPKARQTKQKARIQRFNELESQRADPVARDVRLDLRADHRLGRTILELIYLRKSFDGKNLIRDLSLSLKTGDRIGVIGPNGCGKTTLLRMLLKLEPPTSGKIVRGKNTRMAYFDQERESLDPKSRVKDALGEGDWVTVGGKPRHKTAYLADFLFLPGDLNRMISTLSGGEKARLILARMMLAEANLLILDEPTNDLDIPTIQLLDDSLSNYNGCVIMVTHDRFFLDKVATGILSFEPDGGVRFTEGDYTHYRNRLAEEKTAREADRRESAPAAAAPKKEGKAPSRKGLTFKERLELESIEKNIATLEARRKELEGFLADPAAHASGREDLKDWSDEFARIEQDLEAILIRWENLEARRGA
jgi:ABC transport system ATP-binding/permease protein